MEARKLSYSLAEANIFTSPNLEPSVYLYKFHGMRTIAGRDSGKMNISYST